MARGKVKQELTLEEKLEQALVPVDDQPCEIPDNWCWVFLKNVYKINPKNIADDNIDAAFIPMEKISAGLISEYTYDIQNWAKAKKGHTQFANNDVAFAKISPCFENRKSMILKELPNGIGGGTTELIVLRQPLVIPEYTFYLVSSEDFISKGKGTYSGTVGQQRIDTDYVKNYPVPLPPLAEQQRIVNRIESLFAKIDEVKEKLEAVVESYEIRKAVILHKAFTGELTKSWREKNNISADTWTIKTIGDICKLIGGGTPSKAISDYWNGDIPWASVKDVKGKELFDTLDHITELGLNNSASNICDNGDLILVTRIEPGKSIIAKNKIAINQDLKIVKTDENVLFMHYALQNLQKEFLNKSSGSTVLGITVGNINSIEVNMPSQKEQNEIATIVDNLIESLGSEIRLANNIKAKIDILKKSILARAFRGGLGTNNPEEESSIELLKQILQEK